MSKPTKKSSKKSSKKSTSTSRTKIEKSSEMSAEKFVDISFEIMPKVMEIMISKMESMSKTMQAEQDQNPFEAMGKIMVVMLEAFSEFESDFQALGTSSEGFNEWGNSHEQELNEYLTNNPEAKKKMDAFKKQMEGIMTGKQSSASKSSKEEEGLNVEKAAEIMVKVMTKTFELMIPKWEKKVKTIEKDNRGRELGRLMNEIQSSSEIESFYQSFGTTGKEFDNWMKEHRYEVNNYLDEHMDKKKKMDEFKAKFDDLIKK